MGKNVFFVFAAKWVRMRQNPLLTHFEPMSGNRQKTTSYQFKRGGNRFPKRALRQSRPSISQMPYCNARCTDKPEPLLATPSRAHSYKNSLKKGLVSEGKKQYKHKLFRAGYPAGEPRERAIFPDKNSC